MKRIVVALLLLAVLLAAAHAAATRWAGEQAEQQVHHLLRQLQRDTNLVVEDIQYQKGWYRSRLDYRLRDPRAGGLPELEVTDHIDHGPLLVDGGFRPGLAGIRSEARRSDGRSPVAEADLLVGLDGRLSGSYRLHALSFTDGENMHVSLSGGGGDLVYDEAAHRLHHEGHLDDLRLESEDGRQRLTLRNVHLLQDSRRRSDHLWLGSLELTVGNAHLADADGETLTARELRFGLHTDADNTVFNGNGRLAVERLESSLITVGPGELEVSFDQIGIDAWDRLGVLADKLQARSGDDEAVQLLLFAEGAEVLRRFLEHGPRVGIRTLSLEVDDYDELDFNARFSYPPDVQLNVFNPFAAVEALDAEIRFHLPRPLLHDWARQAATRELQSMQRDHEALLEDHAFEQLRQELAAELVQELADNPLLQLDGDGLRSHLRLDDGILYANGQRLGTVMELLLGGL